MGAKEVRIYELSFSGHDGSYFPYFFRRGDNLKKGKFERICYDAIIAATKGVLEDEQGFIGVNTITKRAAEILVHQYGFCEMNVEYVRLFGGKSLSDEGDFDELEFEFPGELEGRVMMHNQEVRRSIERELESNYHSQLSRR
ncbi:MAG TPA: hypothetical protein HA282_05370 [Nanoarchaeota archaeon]|nr:MAG: hypothetical protein QT01_C0001G0155 [archaeon GW2011_AR6]MBS3082934.1 hypothetical protein [Candidatus Pacearchaeota archaeon]HIH17581.1 hypothetical protein [Nanoarchaeota archaeon]HIH33891.1 hypothetical protein [Nanoarchaeota archaeon]HIH51096.1 hypothetical protein [Nanoarchaeota archaeon]